MFTTLTGISAEPLYVCSDCKERVCRFDDLDLLSTHANEFRCPSCVEALRVRRRAVHIGPDCSCPACRAALTPQGAARIESWNRWAVGKNAPAEPVTVQVTGDALAPRVRDGDELLILPAAQARPGEAVLARIDGNPARPCVGVLTAGGALADSCGGLVPVGGFTIAGKAAPLHTSFHSLCACGLRLYFAALWTFGGVRTRH